MSAEYEELDSFTENLIKRTQERQRLLNDETTDVLSEISSNHSQSSLRSDVLLNDSKNNIKLNESLKDEPIVVSVVDRASKQVIENLSKLSPTRKRVPLNQRLNSIARTYNYEDSENIDYIDDSDTNEESRPKNQFKDSPTKPIRQTPTISSESPPKKRLLLNQRLNQIARSYDSSDDFESKANDFNSPKVMPSTVEVTKPKIDKVMAEHRSPTKKFTLQRNVEIEIKSKVTETESKTTITRSPVKKQTINGETLSPNKSKAPVNGSPLKKLTENNEIKEKLSHFGFEKTEPSVKPKSIYNSIDNKNEVSVITNSTNVSAVRKQFEDNIKKDSKGETPEILPLRAKTQLFEKAILAENEAKSKQYHRKRNAPEVKTVVKPNDYLIANNRDIPSNAVTSEETAIKRQRSNENVMQTKPVANNILLRRQQLEAKLFNNTENSTANAYKKELENRQKEIDLLKKPLKQNESHKPEDDHQEVEEVYQKPDQSYESVDDETAQRAVCDAFEDIENYPNEQSEEESINDNLNSGFDSYKSDSINDKKLNIESSSPSKNRLYPQLFAEPNEICVQSYQTDMDPPEKPPRVYPQNTGTNTTPLRTISFYRREKNQQMISTPPVQTVVKRNANQMIDNIDLAERNRKIQERIDDLNEKVHEMISNAGQASQALNLCLEREEFKSSTQRVEAEKVLLLSGQKRIAFLNEIQRLKLKLNDKKIEPEASKGLLTLSDFRLPLKGEFVVSRAKGNVPEVHHIIGLVNNGGSVTPTNILSTDKDIHNATLEFDFGLQDMTELSSDFQMVVHIFDLITTKQVSHETRYHILKRTPKKNKNTMKSPTIRSPGGPDAVLSTSFRLVGAVVINLKNCQNHSFGLENFEFNSPLEGTLKLKSKLTVRHPFHKEGFFDVRDASGFWNMRWAVLNGTRLGFWRFPEDVATKQPLTVVDLKNCINPKISLIPSHLRHICMRRNTIAMIIADNINASQNIFVKGGSLPRSRPVKLLFSGENKENCSEWSEYLTTALSNIRVWEMDAIKPYSEEEFEKLLMNLQ